MTAKPANVAARFLQASPLSRPMEVYLKSILESGANNGSHRPIPKKIFEALQRRGLVEGGQEVNMLSVGQSGLVDATITPTGRQTAINLFLKEHEGRLAEGQRSERIPKLLKNRGVDLP